MSRHVKPSLNPRVIAFHALMVVASRPAVFAGDVLADAFSKVPALEPRDRALATELVQGVLRWQGLLDVRLGPLVRQGLGKLEPEALNWLRLGAYQVAFLHRMPREIAVSATVDAARAAGFQRVTGLLNAVLRRFASGLAGVVAAGESAEDSEAFVRALAGVTADAPVDAALVARCAGLPPWIAEEAVAVWGETALAEALALRSRASVTLRPTLGRGGAPALVAALEKAGLEGRIVSDGPGAGLVELKQGDAFRTDAWFDGLCVAQDVSSHAVVRRVMDAFKSNQAAVAVDAVVRRPRVLDLCAGRGIKTTALADLGADVVAVDVSERKLDTLKSLVKRLGLEERLVATIATDGTKPDARIDALGPFDIVLVDAPCSGLGTIRRHPEIAWRRTEKDIAALVAIQRGLFERALGLVKPGGEVAFAVCSFVRAEGDLPLPSGVVCVEAVADRPSAGGDAFMLRRFKDLRDA